MYILLKHSIFTLHIYSFPYIIWTASSEFGTYSLCDQWRFRRACASAQSRQNLRCSLIQAVNQEEPSDRKPDPWPLWMAGHAQLKFVMTECSKTQIRLTGLIYKHCRISCWHIPIFSSTLYRLTLRGNRRLIPKMLFLTILIRAIVDLHFY